VKLFALVLIACLYLSSAACAVSWRRPVDGPLLRPFSVSADRYARGQHRGIDLGAPPGASVRSACAGRVRFAGTVPGGGRTVSVGCGRLVATYQHLGAVAVGRGEMLAAGATLGSVGRAGDPATPRPHVHLGARAAATGRYVDPLTLLAGAPRALPPLRSEPRRRAPLGRVPLGPAPLGPAPRPATWRFAPRAAPRAPVTVPAAADRVASPPVPALPLVVWVGLLAFGLGLPLGGLVTLRRRRLPAAAVGRRRWAAAHR
jgi:hypothetical protein